MSDTSMHQREIDVLHHLGRLTTERAEAEEKVSSFQGKFDALERQFHAARQAVAKKYQDAKAATEAAFQEARQAIENRFQAEHPATEGEYNKLRRTIAARAAKQREAAKDALEGTKWNATAVFDAAMSDAKQKDELAQKQIAAQEAEVQAIIEDAKTLAQQLRHVGGDVLLTSSVAVEPAPAPEDDPLPRLQERNAEAYQLLQDLDQLFLPKFVKLVLFIPLVVILALIAGGVGLAVLGIKSGQVAAITVAVVILGAGFGLRAWLVTIARVKVARIATPLRAAIGDAERLVQQARTFAAMSHERRRAEIQKRWDDEIRKGEEKFKQQCIEADKRAEEDSRQADEKYLPLLAQIQKRRDEDLKQAEEQFRQRRATVEQRHQSDKTALEERYRQDKDKLQAAFEAAWNAMAQAWRDGMAQVQADVQAINSEVDRFAPAWSDLNREHWVPTDAIAPGIKFGEFTVDLAQMPKGLPLDEKLRAATPMTRFSLPAILTFPDRGSLLVKTTDAGKDRAVQTLQATMLRFLTTLPPGKVRFTIIDPIGLGQNFASFMHLVDFNEALVTSRIWTEPQHIEQRLLDLSEHMENVIQKYLRNEYPTIEAYNEMAGEVAEPYRILVVANFPANFTEATARRLVSIASSGPRCGVYTLISVDMKQPLPQGFNLKDLERYSVNLVWKEQRYVWKEPEVERYLLKLETPPPADAFKEIVLIAGQKAKDAHRVEVPFEYVAPAPDQWWAADSAKEIDVPLGRAGATRLQHLKLGKGTSQHVLTAGRTGSGKSTLLHALITNVALRYSPEQIELYLIDFKKGVEFKTYATEDLPHARVVAIESEREFGLSVLQRLDVELRVRGEKYRAVGAQDVASYREADGAEPLPRILLIVDEFQEFFIEDDKVAQEAALLLDRLVRQGRAFGIHVILGSQTLAGAYSLARSTLGQMAVRIALQCSEADAHLILSEENSAARLLSRPGEAIYNDANGLVEGNHPFQVVWLGDERRQDYLKRIHDLATRRKMLPKEPQIVFEGNRPADLTRNPLLHALLAAHGWPQPPKVWTGWLGDAVAIKDPTAAIFRPQSGSNLLIIGQQEESALGILAAILLSIAAQHAPPEPANGATLGEFYLLDGSPIDSPFHGTLGQIGAVVPHPVRAVAAREVPQAIAEIAGEVERRQTSPGAEATPIFLLIYDLQRLRDLRKAEDDYGFSSSSDDTANPAKQFANILREGPPLGVHTIAWCDTLNNVNRTLDRQSLREFEMRVLFQMSANDSSNLIDSPAANRLGTNRALFFSEEQGQLEKFRPYSPPPAEWLEWVRHQWRGRRAVAAEAPVGS
jgi:S-DNA-T family DNA segregation ATPase FtsK/SpoIIIE